MRIQPENCQIDKTETDFQNDKIEGRDSLIESFFDERSRIRQKLWLECIFRINIIRLKILNKPENREKKETWNSETLKKGVCYSGIRNSLKLSKRVSQITSLYSKWAHWITAHWVFEYWIKIQHSMLPPRWYIREGP